MSSPIPQAHLDRLRKWEEENTKAKKWRAACLATEEKLLEALGDLEPTAEFLSRLLQRMAGTNRRLVDAVSREYHSYCGGRTPREKPGFQACGVNAWENVVRAFETLGEET